jgi:anti-sigma B factor antagonist
VSRHGGQLKLLKLTDRVQNLLVITKLLTVFDAYEDEAEALKSFG